MSTILPFHAPHERATQQVVVVSGVCETTGAQRSVPVTRRAADLFEAALEDAKARGPVDAEALFSARADLEVWDAAATTRLLADLALQGGVEGFEIIAELRMELPPEVKDIAELAFAMALGWLGFDYCREADDTAPQVRAAA